MCVVLDFGGAIATPDANYSKPGKWSSGVKPSLGKRAPSSRFTVTTALVEGKDARSGLNSTSSTGDATLRKFDLVIGVERRPVRPVASGPGPFSLLPSVDAWNYFFISKDLTPRARPGGRCLACSRCSASSSGRSSRSASPPGWRGRRPRAPRAESRSAVPGLRRQLRIGSARHIALAVPAARFG